MKLTGLKIEKFLISKSFMIKKLSLGNFKGIYLKEKEFLMSVNRNLKL
jgi:hypothetical protein